MRVDVYLRNDEGKERQFLMLPEGQSEMPLPAQSKTWRHLFAMSTDDNLLDVPIDTVEASIRHKGFALLRPEHWSGDWSEATAFEIDDLSDPSAWQNKWHLA